MSTRLVRIVAAMAIVCFLSACSSSTRVPASDYSKVEPGKRVVLDVTTVDAHYRVTKFSMTDSTLVIEDVVESGGTYPSSTRWTTPPNLPFALPLDQIASLQRIEEAHPVADVFSGVGLFAAIVVVLVFIGLHQIGFFAGS